MNPGGDPAGVLDHASRSISKATLVPVLAELNPREGRALAKSAFVRSLALQAGEVRAVRANLPQDAVLSQRSRLWQVLGAFEGAPMSSVLPKPTAFAGVSADALTTFGTALVDLRKQRLAELPASASIELGLAQHLVNQAVAVTEGFTVNMGLTPLGMLNLERLEMAPAGIERGELLATIPLAPLEKTSVVQKEWSVTSQEFTSIVTDSLENYSEKGVTDNTELAQATTSQTQHGNQFNITGTVQGGISMISASTTMSFGAQDASSQSATDSRKHAVELTSKASTRAKQEHKVTISTTSESGQSLVSTRNLENPSPTDPVRIDYFSLMRKWRVRLYRYGLRLTYDVVVPEPAGALREPFAELERLRSQLGPFTFPVKHSDISDELVDKNGQPDPAGTPKYLWLADVHGAKVPPRPGAGAPMNFTEDLGGPPGGKGNYYKVVPFSVPDGFWITQITMVLHVNANTGIHFGVEVLGSDFNRPPPQDDQTFPPAVLHANPGPGNFLEHETGPQQIAFVFLDANAAIVDLSIDVEPLPEVIDQWRSDVWSALYDAAQARYYSEQQEIAAQIADIENDLSSVDTLTLRREENDEIMKSVLRWLLGTTFAFMPPAVTQAFAEAGVDLEHGIGFTGSSLDFERQLDFGLFKLSIPDPGAWAVVEQHEAEIRFINEAIEWENVVTFLYSYFWDVPPSWDFIRRLRHPDPTRQAFLRAGSARVVLTVRKGWEEAWVRFAEGGFSGAAIPDNHPYLTIAQEIAAYDDRNYPGIPPANPARTVYTQCSAQIAPAPANPDAPVVIPVASSDGFTIGTPVVIDSLDARAIQEQQVVVDLPDASHITVGRLEHAHDGTRVPFPIAQPVLPMEEATYTTSSAKVGPSAAPVAIPVTSSSGFVVGQQVVVDSVDARGIQEAQAVVDVPDGTHVTVARLDNEHDGTGTPFPLVQPGEKGVLIAEWNEYTPTSGTDIAVQSNLRTIA